MAQTTIQGGFLGADLVSAQTALTSGLATTDEIIVSDAGVIKRMDISVIEIAATQITASGTLPALNGAALTALNGSEITSGTLPAARIAADSVVEGKLNVSNGPTNGYVLTARDGVAGGFTWEAAAASGANTALSNLASVVVNATINMNNNTLSNIGSFTSDKKLGEIDASHYGSGDVRVTASETDGSTSNILMGMRVRGAIGGSSNSPANTQNWTNAVALRAIHVENSTESGGSGAITGAAGIYIANGTAGGATITTQYGIYMEDLTAGGTDIGIRMGADLDMNDFNIINATGTAKVWCLWEQAGAHGITASYNMTSVTDGGGLGDTDHVFATDFSSTAYSLVTGGSTNSSLGSDVNAAGTATTLTRNISDGNPADYTDNNLVGFGDQ